MKATGIVRKVDLLGRVVLPKGLRTNLNIKEKDALEIYVDSEVISLKEYEPDCIFGGRVNNLRHYKGKKMCTNESR